MQGLLALGGGILVTILIVVLIIAVVVWIINRA